MQIADITYKKYWKECACRNFKILLLVNPHKPKWDTTKAQVLACSKPLDVGGVWYKEICIFMS